MQSTGQTSTQDLSFTLMHGSAIMYGIEASRLSYALAAGRTHDFVPEAPQRVKRSTVVARTARPKNSVGGLTEAHGATHPNPPIASGGAGRERRAASRRRG